MRVSIGTIEIEDAERKLVRRDMDRRGHATRADVKEWVESLIRNRLNALANPESDPEE